MAFGLRLCAMMRFAVSVARAILFLGVGVFLMAAALCYIRARCHL